MPVIEQQSSDQVVTLRCGHQLIRLQTTDSSKSDLQADKPTVGAGDLCLVSGDDVQETLHHFKSYYVDVIAGPVEKYGSEGKMTSIYLHDPDNNLIEVSFYKDK